MSGEQRTLKGLLLQMKLDTNPEMRILAEEEIVLAYQALQQKLAVATKALEYSNSRVCKSFCVPDSGAHCYECIEAREALEKVK